MKTDKGQTAFDIDMEKNYKKIIRMIHEAMVEQGASNQLKDCVICFKPRKGTLLLFLVDTLKLVKIVVIKLYRILKLVQSAGVE